MAEQDIYKLVEELNKRKSAESKIDDIYNLLDEVQKEKGLTSTSSQKATPSSRSRNLKDLVKKPIKPDFPKNILPYEKRSECFLNILRAVDYGDNNQDYQKGHEDALSKYYTACMNNAKDLYVVQGQVNDEYNICCNGDLSNNYNKGYFDGIAYVVRALEESRTLMGKKIAEKLGKELS